ncbi:MAG: pitrilysin family protein [Proteobacteria bacterium]|nr:pitrilysin family protein [Pseudomonadota bacterium]
MNRPSAMRAFALSLVLLPAATAFGAEGVKLPAYKSATLANGAVVALVEKRDTPLVSMNVTVRGGGLGDPANKDGTASLYADLIQKGAGNRTAAQFAEAIENVGGSLSAGAGSESVGINASFMSRDVDLMLELVADALQRPRLDAAEFEKARTLAVQSIVAAKDSDPRALMSSYGDAWLFRGHPYGRSVGGSEASLAAVKLDDIKRYYADQVGGDRLIITMVGDFDSATMLPKLERSFGTWRKAGASVPTVPPPAKVMGRPVLLVDKPGATQTYFWLGNVGASRTDPARTAQSVVNTVFGGRFTSMLNTELRVKSGLTYGASASFSRPTQPGSFHIGSYTETSKTTQAIDMALDTLARLHKDGLDADQLKSSQSYMLGQFPPTIETNGQIAGRLADMLFYGLGPEDVNEYAERVLNVDAVAVRSTIEQSFPQPDDVALVLIGDAAKIRDAVRKYGPVTEMKITDPRFTPAAK